MTIQATHADWRFRRLPQSIGAILFGFFVIVVLSIGTDQILHSLEVYPPWGQPMPETGDNVLALTYRCVYAVIGCYLAAKFAPRAPMRHALILGAVGFVLSSAGAVAMWDFGPNWYPIALAVSSWPCAWLGGVLYNAGQSGGRR